ncbi:MAG: hypothetical protein HWN80_17905 [Candidatus Lokiarchaeota archaeon]|nr:hypothetical protein [Candidatus Lokiarchaeota archaeon]
MEYNKCQKDMIYYVIDYYNSAEGKLTPCVKVFKQIFNEKYSHLEIEENARALVSSGILTPHSFHEYLGLTNTFITSLDYKLFRNKKI